MSEDTIIYLVQKVGEIEDRIEKLEDLFDRQVKNIDTLCDLVKFWTEEVKRLDETLKKNKADVQPNCYDAGARRR